MLPSTNPKASAPRTSTFSVLISPAHPYRYRRFACPLAGTDARLAEKRGSVTPSFQGTYTPYLLPVRLAHRILVLPYWTWCVVVGGRKPKIANVLKRSDEWLTATGRAIVAFDRLDDD